METIKVLAVVRDKDANDYWRLKYPLEKLNGLDIENKKIEIEFKEFDKDYIFNSDYNILMFEWDIPLTIQEIGLLQNKGKKILYSISDYWEFSEIHPYYNNPFKKEVTKNTIRQYLIVCDGVIVTTERLALRVIKYNDNVAILPNFANPEEFKQFSEKTKSDKLRIALIGSLSHYPDFLLFKQVLNKIAKNKKIIENCQFQLCGVGKDEHWQYIINMFKKKKHIDFVVKEALSYDKYLEFYQDCDISLLPLEHIEYNVCKSALKLWENAVTNTLPIGSSLYSGKELKGLIVAETPLEYEQSIEKLLDKDYYNKLLKYITETNLKDCIWEKRIEDTKLVINTIYSEDLSPKLNDVNIFTITYDKEQQSEYNNYDNSHIRTIEQKSYLFEWNPIVDIVSNKIDNNGYTGIFSYKFSNKTGFVKNMLYKTLNAKKYEEYDYINLAKNYWKNGKGYLDFTESSHPGILERIKEVCDVVGLNYTEMLKNINHSNFFIMKNEYYKDFVENYIIPAIKYMELKPERFMVDANYLSGLKKEKLKELTGMDFYSFHTFILERLILFYIENKNLKTLNVL